MPSKRPRTRFEDIIFNIEAIRRYTKALNKQAFVLPTRNHRLRSGLTSRLRQPCPARP